MTEAEAERQALALIARVQAMPKRFRVRTIYADGRVRQPHDTATRAQAENWAAGQSRKVGRDLIDRETGETVRVVDVVILDINQESAR